MPLEDRVTRTIKIAPSILAADGASSILAADGASLGEAVKIATKAGADAIHIDIMDGHFVPNLSFGAHIVKNLRACSTITFDVHLMIDPYEPHLQAFADAGADIITIHLEAQGDKQQALKIIRSWGIKAGLAVNPKTSFEELQSFNWGDSPPDQIIVMTVEPGFGGQKLIPSALQKVRKMKDYWGDAISLVADGGVTTDNAAQVREAGADVLVAGSSFFNQGDKSNIISHLRGEMANG